MMSRIARIVIPGFPHHVVQRGNRRQPTFFHPEDYREYLKFISFWCRHHHVKIWAYCLMTNHVHLVLVPETADSLRRAVGEAHRRYVCYVNFRERWRGHLFQGRFSSYPLDTRHLLLAVRYIERNPLEAGLVREPELYAWSSANAHVTGKKNPYLDSSPLFDDLGNWKDYLLHPLSAGETVTLQRHERTGRPFGEPSFVMDMERRIGRSLFPRKRGPKRKDSSPELSMVSPK